MTGTLFDEFEDAPCEGGHICLDCGAYSGSVHDYRGFLLRRRAGYCEERIARGDWNVVQSIDSPRSCPDFRPAPDEVRARRWKALRHYTTLTQNQK